MLGIEDRMNNPILEGGERIREEWSVLGSTWPRLLPPSVPKIVSSRAKPGTWIAGHHVPERSPPPQPWLEPVVDELPGALDEATAAEDIYQEGRKHEHGLGIPKDPVRARQCYEAAANLQHTKAQATLGFFFT